MAAFASKTALIFDMDGVLMHSAPAHAEAFHHVLKQRGLASIDYDQYAGQSTKEAMRRILSSQCVNYSEQEIQDLSREKSAYARRILKQSPPLAEQCRLTLAKLRLHHRLALATSASRETMALFLNASGTADLFDHLLCGEDVSKAKPDPEIYQRTLEALGVSPGEAVVIEDSPSGVRAAQRAGIDVIGITGTLSEEVLSESNVIQVVDRLADLAPQTSHSAVAIEDLVPITRDEQIDRKAWTAVIPAAGRGSRLGYHLPKVLYPLLGRPLLDWMLDCLTPVCERFVFVLSPEGRQQVAPFLEARLGDRLAIAIQSQPIGMANAILQAAPHVQTEHSLVTWCDQALLSPLTVSTCAKYHAQNPRPILTLPTVVKPKPYIHFVRDESDRIQRVLQVHEGEITSDYGENDCGVFAFQSHPLFTRLKELSALGQGRGTGEFNLLQVLPELCRDEQGESAIKTIRIWDQSEAHGINTPWDVDFATNILKKRHGDQKRAAVS